MKKLLTGIAASPGMVASKALVLNKKEISYDQYDINDVEAEQKRVAVAIDKAEAELKEIKTKVATEVGEEEAEIFQAHLMVLRDPEITSAVEERIQSEQINAETALDEAFEKFANLMSRMDDQYMKERAGDIRDVKDRVLRKLLGIENVSLATLEEEVILIAEDLTPTDTAQLNKDKVLGFVTQAGGRTSHTAIMARSLEIPAVVGVENLLAEVETDMEIILDGKDGEVLVEPNEKERKAYKEKAHKYQEHKEKLQKLKDLPAQTRDGHRVELAANIGTPADVTGALENGAEGVGLYRSEFLYMDRQSLPSEEEQFKAYKEVAEKMDGPVIIRTLDVGGDKELSYLDLPKEMNPFLGYRAIRLCLDKEEIFISQLRAILRASAYGDIKIMYPMISNIEELRAANQVLAKVEQDLIDEGINFDKALEVGLMIEVPSAAVIADLLAKESDFFSIGTNDLIQYTTASDRMNEQVSASYQPFHPAVLRLIEKVVDAAHAEGNWAGMCGEMAGNKLIAPFLLGIGLDEFSMSAISILEIKNLIRNLSLEQAEKIAYQALTFSTAKEAKEYLTKAISELEEV